MKRASWELPTALFSGPPADITADVVAAVGASETEADIVKAVVSYACRFGVTHVLAGAMPYDGQSMRQQIGNVLLNGWPSDWTRQYFANGYLRDDPTIKMVRDMHRPFLWSEIDVRWLQNHAARSIMDEAREFGLKQGLTFAFPTMGGTAIGVSMAGENIEIGDVERKHLSRIALHAVARALQLRSFDAVSFPQGVTDRERQALLLAADGWTDAEIGMRMGITRYGVEKHLRSVREKLEARNTVNALAIAMRLGIVQ